MQKILYNPSEFHKNISEAIKCIKRLTNHNPRLINQQLVFKYPFEIILTIFPQEDTDINYLKTIKAFNKNPNYILISPSISKENRYALQKKGINYCSIDGYIFIRDKTNILLIEQPLIIGPKLPLRPSSLSPCPINGLNLSMLQIVYAILNNRLVRGLTNNELLQFSDIHRSSCCRYMNLFINADWIARDPLYLYKITNRKQMEEVWVKNFFEKAMPTMFRAFFSFISIESQKNTEQDFEKSDSNFSSPYMLKRCFRERDSKGILHLFTDLDQNKLKHTFGLQFDPRGNIAIYRRNLLNNKLF
ncbi:MAG: hypothetical protein ACEPOW_09905 [Bacteroidales bacterium]